MNKDDVAGLHPAAVEAAQIYFDHHSDNGGTFECGSKIAHHVHDALTTLSAENEKLRAEALEWKVQHENLLSVRQQDLSAMQAKIDGLQKEIAFKNEAMLLTKGCPGKVVVRNGFYKIDCYKKKYTAKP